MFLKELTKVVAEKFIVYVVANVRNVASYIDNSGDLVVLVVHHCINVLKIATELRKSYTMRETTQMKNSEALDCSCSRCFF